MLVWRSAGDPRGCSVPRVGMGVRRPSARPYVSAWRPEVQVDRRNEVVVTVLLTSASAEAARRRFLWTPDLIRKTGRSEERQESSGQTVASST